MSNQIAGNESVHKARIAWERLTEGVTWAGGARLPLMLRLARANKVVIPRYEEHMGLSIPQMRILIEALDPDGVIQSALHKYYGIDPASISRTLQAMERDDLVTRRVDEQDSRNMRVFLTEKGRAIAESFPERIAEFEQRMVAGLSDEEILQMHRLFEHIENNLTGNE
ncbi:MAG: MarR family transcriptional regulator [Chloroflexi bacterium]|uniref:MarR family transcriptional regulator n=1 Tax=Candidatus Chlorohelix allophototropha TaxID=3003348 RepID=A0A8T7M9H3_9CHLR|nr:MarR family transcriptional regulator [Chloroflexota bacterium]WJW68728.1 MarR family transcriptional regulator [Chloroflexota bacterium L227-S17]